MKVCIVSLSVSPVYDTDPAAAYGGAEVQAAFVADALRRAGQSVTLVVADLKPGLELPYPVEKAFDSRAGVPGLRFFHPRATGIQRALKRANADVYFQRNAGPITGQTALFCRRQGKVFVYGAGSNTDFSMRSVRLPRWFDKALYYMGLKLASGIIVQNRFQKELCERQLAKPVEVIPNGVLTSDADDRGGGRFIMWVGGLRPVKQPELFLELARRLPDVSFLMVGAYLPYEADCAASIRDAARSIPNLELSGWLPNSEVLARVRDASLLVNTSSVEGFPNAYLEAWKYRVPVVTFNDVDGMIASHDLGVVCGDIDGMEATVRSLLGDREARFAMGDRARAIVLERFSPQALGEAYAQFFERLRGAR